MTGREKAFEYMDLLARGLGILEKFQSKRFEEIETLSGFENITEKTHKILDDMWVLEKDFFLQELAKMIDKLERDFSQDRFVIAYEICGWMDEHITYKAPEKNSEKMSLWPICKIDGVSPTVIGALNKNYDEVGIWINPKFPIRCAYDIDNSREISIANRDAFLKMNGLLNNCNYFSYDKSKTVKNIIISSDFLARKKEEDDVLAVAFAPLTSIENIVQRHNVEFERNEYKCGGMEFSLSSDIIKVEERMKRDWLAAVNNNIDILFMPEMLGTEMSCGIGKKYIPWVKELYIEIIKQQRTPAVTILPSYWVNRSNSATIVSDDGLVLGIQKKSEPFISRKDHAQEALDEFSPKETILIHIPNVNRMGVLICSEFLSDEEANWREYICGCLGMTLLLVPSYSCGEKDFINFLPKFKDYDTTVVWGNCCGAIQSKSKGIGGCGIAGTNVTELFGNTCECDHKCGNVEACLFKVRVSLIQLVTKKKMKKNTPVIIHCLE